MRFAKDQRTGKEEFRNGVDTKTAAVNGQNGHARRNAPGQINPGLINQWLAMFNQVEGGQGGAMGQSPERLVESIAILQTLAENSTDGVYLKDRAGRYVMANPAYAYWLRMAPEALIGKTDRELFAPVQADLLGANDAQIMASGSPRLEDVQLDREDGSRVFAVHKMPFRNAQQQVIGLLGVARDGQPRKDAEGDLRESKQFSDQIIASAREGVVVFNAELRYVLWNQFIEELTGFPKSKVLGRYPLEVFPTAAESGVLKLLERALNGETITSQDMCIETMRGPKSAWVSCSYSPHRDLRGNIIGVICTVSDISERKKAENALKRSQQFNQQVINNASDGVVVYDRELRYMLWNPALEQLSGIAASSLIGRRVSEVETKSRENGLEQMLRQALIGDMVESEDFQLSATETVWVRARYSPLRDGDDQIIGVIGVVTDITGRRAAEEALRESQQFNEQIFASAREGISVYDRELRLIAWNPFLADLSGYRREDIVGQKILEVAPQLLEPRAPELLARALNGEVVPGFDFQFLSRPDKWASAVYGPLRNPQGEIVGVIATVRDVTARRESEEKLSFAAKFNEQIIHSSLDSILVLDTELRFTSWNPAAEHLTGISADQVVGKNARAVFSFFAADETYERLQAALQGTVGPRVDCEFNFTGRAGWLTVQTSPLQNERGQIVGVIVVLRDVTARKAAEDALRESQQFNEQIIHSAREGIVVYDNDLRFVEWNPFMEELRGLGREHVVGKHPFEVFPELRATEFLEVMQRVLNGDNYHTHDFPQMRTDGKQVWMTIRYQPLRSREGNVTGVLGVVTDITARKRFEEELRESQQFNEQIISNAREGIVVYNKEFKIQVWNRFMQEVTGLSADQIQGRHPLEALPFLRNTGHLNLFGASLNGEAVTGQDIEIVAPHTGKKYWLSPRFGPHLSANGEQLGVIVTLRDVTSRRFAEQAVRESEERYRSILETIQDGYYEFNLKGDLIFFNDALCRIYGADKAELYGKAYQRLLSAETLQRNQQVFSATLASRKPSAPFDYEVTHKDGTRVRVETSAILIVDAAGRPVGFRGIVRDVTERLKAEENLRLNEQRLRAIWENALDAMLLCDDEGYYRDVNPATCRMVGRPKDEIIGKHLTDFALPENVEKARAAWSSMIQHGSDQGTFLLPLGDREPLVIEYSNTANVLPQRHLAIWRDGTARQQVELALRESEQRFRTLVEKSFDGIALLDAQGVTKYVSPSFTRILGYAATEVVGRTQDHLINPEYREALSSVRQAVIAEAGGTKACEYLALHQDGSSRWIEAQITNCLDEPTVRALVVNFRDVTERKNSEKEIRSREEKFRAVWDSAMDAMLIVNDEMQYIDANQAACELYGVSREKLLNRTMADFVAVNRQAEARRSLEKLVHFGERKGQFQLQRPGQTLREIEYSARANVLPVMHLSVMRDVTDRVRAEEALRTSEENYRSVISAMEEGIVLIDAHGQLVTANQSAERILGMTRHDILTRGITDPAWRSIHEDGRPFMLVESPGHITMQTGQPCSSVVWGLLRTPDATEPTWIKINSQPVFTPNSTELSGVVLSLTDITESKRSEIKLRESESRFSMAFQSNPQPMVIIDDQSRLFVNVNDAWLCKFGYTAAEVIGHNGEELGLWLNQAAQQEMQEQLAQAGQLRDWEIALRQKNSEIRYCLLSADFINLDGKRYQLVTCNDITDRKQAELAVRLSEQRFAQAFNACPDPMMIMRMEDGQCVAANAALQRVSGMSSADLLGNSQALARLWVDPKQQNAITDELRQNGIALDVECQFRLQEGALGEFLLSAELFDIDGVEHALAVARDITERKSNEEALRTSEERFSKAFAASPQPISISSMADGRFFMLNQAWCKAMGFSAEEALGKNSAELNLWVDLDQRKHFYQCLDEHGEVRNFAITFRTKDGSIRQMELSGDVIMLDNQKYLLSILLDLTERRKAEANLHASEVRFTKAFNASPQPMAILSLTDQRFVSINSRFCQQLGYAETELIGKTLYESRLWQNPKSYKQVRVALLTAGTISNQEIQYRTKGGDVRTANVSAETIEIDGRPHILMAAEDVTERKKAEDALRQSEERFSKAFHVSPQPLIIFRADDQQPAFLNQCFLQMCGLPDNYDPGNPATRLQLWADEQARREFFGLLHERGTLREWETVFVLKAGEVRNFVIAAESIPLDGRPHILMVALDITERKQAAAKLAEQHEQLRQLSARLNEIREEERTNISREIHDSLGQLLTGLKLDVAWIGKRIATVLPEGDNRESLLDKTRGVTNLLDTTIQSVRDLATQLRPGVLDALGLCAAIEWQVQDWQARSGIDCDLWLCPEPKGLSKDKSTACFRILQEILTNVVRHAQAKRITIHLVVKGNNLELTVFDNGRGISTGELNNTNSLGLLGMRERARSIGGHLTLEGKREMGTTVNLSFPLAD